MNQERFDIEYEGNRILENTRIDGNLETDKSVYLDGMIQGNVHAGKLVIINKGGRSTEMWIAMNYISTALLQVMYVWPVKLLWEEML